VKVTVKTIIALYYDQDTDTVFLKAPYNKQFVMGLKELVPFEDRNPKTHDGRGWDPDTKLWGFAADYKDEVCELARDSFGDIEVVWE